MSSARQNCDEEGRNEKFAQFNTPRGLCVDGDGNIIVADELNHRIRKISPQGVVSTIAGTDVPGHRDGVRRAALFSYPAAVAIDWTDDSILVADEGNHCIRRISPNGLVTTVAGAGKAGYRDGNASYALFRSPCGVTVDWDGNILVADHWNGCVRKISPRGKVSTLLRAGENNNAQLSYPMAIAMDYRNYNITVGLVGTTHCDPILKISARGPNTVAVGVGKLSDPNMCVDAAAVCKPCGVDVGWNSDVIVVDASTCRVYKISPTGVMSVLAGTGEPGYRDGDCADAQFNCPMGVAVDADGNIIVADEGNHCIRRISDGQVVTLAGNCKPGYRDGDAGCTACISDLDDIEEIEDNCYNTRATSTVHVWDYLRKLPPGTLESRFSRLKLP